MPPYMYVERARQSYGAVDQSALAVRMTRPERALLRAGLVRGERWRALPVEGLYQLVIAEVLDNGACCALERGGGRAFAVTGVLDLGLRMMESDRGRTGELDLEEGRKGCVRGVGG